MFLYILLALFPIGIVLITSLLLKPSEKKESRLNELMNLSKETLANIKVKRDLNELPDVLVGIEKKYIGIGKNFNLLSFVLISSFWGGVTAILSYLLFSRIYMGILFFFGGIFIPMIMLDTKYRKAQKNTNKKMKELIKILRQNVIGASNASDVFRRSVKTLPEPFKSQLNMCLEKSINTSIEYEIEMYARRMNNNYLRILAVLLKRVKVSGTSLSNPLKTINNMVRTEEKLASYINEKKKEGVWMFYILLIIFFVVLVFVKINSPEHFKSLISSPNGGISLITLVSVLMFFNFLFVSLLGRE